MDFIVKTEHAGINIVCCLQLMELACRAPFIHTDFASLVGPPCAQLKEGENYSLLIIL